MNPIPLDWELSVLTTRPFLLGLNPNYMLSQALGPNLIPRLSGIFESYKTKCSDQHRVSETVSLPMLWTKVGLYKLLYQLTRYQDQNFASPDIKESAFLKPSSGIRWCCKLLSLLSINFFYKISNSKEREKEGKSEIQKMWKSVEKRSIFDEIKRILDNFLKFWSQH